METKAWHLGVRLSALHDRMLSLKHPYICPGLIWNDGAESSITPLVPQQMILLIAQSVAQPRLSRLGRTSEREKYAIGRASPEKVHVGTGMQRDLRGPCKATDSASS